MVIEGRAIFSGRPVALTLEEGRVTEVIEIGDRADLPFLVPGFLDLQVNGYQGDDYTSPTFDAPALHRIIAALVPSGTTRHLPTIITSPRERILRTLRILAERRRGSPEIAEAIPGFHIEGPFITPEDGARGAHSLAAVRPPDYEEFLAWQEAAEGAIRIVTLSPEWPGALSVIERLVDDGVIVSIGHTAATPERIREAIAAGARMSTHLGNGSHATLPRLKNYLWEQLAADELVAGIICDGYHLPSSVVKTIARAKGLERLVLVSDVAVHGGATPGVYPWNDVSVEVHPDGHLGLEGTEFLAGAGHLLDRSIALFTRYAGVSLADSVRLATLAPAALLGLPHSESFFAIGDCPDLVVCDLSPGADALTVRQVLRRGLRVV